MRNPEHFLFFAEHVSKDSVILTSDECHHITKVLRLGEGDSFNVSDGNGMIFECKNLQPSKHQATAQIIRKISCPDVLPTITLFIGIPERNAFESILEASSPLNIHRIVPVVCAYCQDRWWETKWEKLFLRFKAVMISGMKQSLNPHLPKLNTPGSFSHSLSQADKTLLLADEKGQSIIALSESLKSSSSISCFIGPPGGFSEDEKQALTTAGALSVKLSHHRLRTELAAMSLVAMVGQ